MVFNWVWLYRFGFRAFLLGTSGKSNDIVFLNRRSLMFVQVFFSRIDITVEASPKTIFASSVLRSGHYIYMYVYIYIYIYIHTYLYKQVMSNHIKTNKISTLILSPN